MTTTSSTPVRPIGRELFLARLADHLAGGGIPVAVALSDLDGFAELNERVGRAAGDGLLALWESVLVANLPRDAEVHRLGGDEYAAILPAHSVENALIIADEIRTLYARQAVGVVGDAATATLGVAANPPHGATSDDLLKAAEQALMRAKRDGGDRVAIYVEEKMVLKSNYYSRAALDRLAKVSAATNRTEASLLREALDDLVDKLRGEI